MLSPRLEHYLDDNHAHYVVIRHPLAYTAQQVAAMTHVHGWELAKTTILKLDGELVMAVVPAPYIIDFESIRVASGAPRCTLRAARTHLCR